MTHNLKPLATDQKSLELENARWARFDHSPQQEDYQLWLDWLVAETEKGLLEHAVRKNKRKSNSVESFRSSVGAFAVELIKHSLNREAAGYFFRSADRQLMSATLVTSRAFDELVEGWQKMGFLESSTYMHNPGLKQFNKTRRYRATPVFLDHAKRFGVDAAKLVQEYAEQSKGELVRLRAGRMGYLGETKRGRLLPVVGARGEAVIAEVEALNELMAGYDYSLKDVPQVRRVFGYGDLLGFDFNLGGRFYAKSKDDWIAKKSQERANILIDGQQTVEVDVRASQLTVLYGLCEKPVDFSSDPYWVEGLPRNTPSHLRRALVKGLVTAAIGSGRLPKRWPQRLSQELESEYGVRPASFCKASEIVEPLSRKHPVLLQLSKETLDWGRLQFEEAECFRSAMMTLHQKYNIPSLPVHDSLIVKQGDAEIVSEVLSGAYQDRLGVRPVLTVK